MKKLNNYYHRITLNELLLAFVLISSITICSINISFANPKIISFISDNGTEIIKDVPIDAVFYNECCDEAVHVFGTAHIFVNDNIIHTVVSDMAGTGLSSGYNYTGQGTSVETNVFYSNHIEGIFTFKLSMTNEDGCSFRMKATFRIEANANGDIVVDFQNLETKCHP